MTFAMERVTLAKNLPDAWDDMAGCIYRKRSFLQHTERYNPCEQRYYLLRENGDPVSGAIVYTLELNLFTFTTRRLPFKMNIVGIPCSVSSSGLVGSERYLPEFIDRIKFIERGFLVFLNLDAKPDITGIMIGKTLPTVLLENRFPTNLSYATTLNADYRRRMKRIRRAGLEIEVRKGTCSRFSPSMHEQYLQVLAHSKGKLETLSTNFFRNLPDPFSLTTFHHQGKLLGWHITVPDESTHRFFLGGFDYTDNPLRQTYFNILFDILDETIDRGLLHLELGQTAEIPKMRLGGVLQPKWLAARHSNPVIGILLRMLGPVLEYSGTFPDTHPFKELR